MLRRNARTAVSAAVAQRRLESVAPPHLADVAIDVDTATDGPPPPRGRHGRHAAPPSREAPRWMALTAQQITLIAVAVTAVVLVAAWWVMHALPRAEPVQLAGDRILPSASTETALGAASVAGGSGGPSSAAPTTAAVVVDVAGKVRKPGIVELPAGSRVVDALRAVGGPRPGVDTSALNLARLLVDGEQIVVGEHTPAMPSGGSGASTTAALAPINLNTATQEQLEALPGIGPVTAQAILTWRAENGSFTSVDELLEVSGIGDATLADIEAYVYV